MPPRPSCRKRSWRTRCRCRGGACRRRRLAGRSEADRETSRESADRRIAHQSFDFRKRHSSDAGKKSPLVTIRIEINIQEYTVAVGARHVLQRQGDEVSKAALGHGVLARKETVIRIETELMPSLHRARQNRRAKFSGEAGRQRRFKEDPYVSAPPRARAFDGDGNPPLITRLLKRARIILPGCLVKISRQKPAGFVAQ